MTSPEPPPSPTPPDEPLRPRETKPVIEATTRPETPTSLSPAERKDLLCFLEDISVAFDALYQIGELTQVEYLATIMSEFDGLFEDTEELDLGSGI
jgi:hypothetical protein